MKWIGSDLDRGAGPANLMGSAYTYAVPRPGEVEVALHPGELDQYQDPELAKEKYDRALEVCGPSGDESERRRPQRLVFGYFSYRPLISPCLSRVIFVDYLFICLLLLLVFLILLFYGYCYCFLWFFFISPLFFISRVYFTKVFGAFLQETQRGRGREGDDDAEQRKRLKKDKGRATKTHKQFKF